MEYKKYNGIEIPDVSKFQPTPRTFLNADIFTNYIDFLLVFHNVCKFNSGVVDHYFLEIDITTLMYKISNDFYINMSLCHNRYIIIPIHLRVPNTDRTLDYTTVGHSNFVIIDRKSKIIELFEPHGVGLMGIDTDTVIETTIHNIFPVYSSFNFTNMSSLCYAGIQGDNNLCLAWSLLLIDIKLLNDDIDSPYIISLIKSMGENVDLYLRKYIGGIEQFPLQPKTFSEYQTGHVIKNDNILRLHDVIPHTVILGRINTLLSEYQQVVYDINLIRLFETDIYDEKTKSLQLESKLILQELMIYNDFPDFNNILLDFFKKTVC